MVPAVSAARAGGLVLTLAMSTGYLDVVLLGAMARWLCPDGGAGCGAGVAVFGDELSAAGSTGVRRVQNLDGATELSLVAIMLVVEPSVLPGEAGLADGWENAEGFRVVVRRRDFGGLVRPGAGVRAQVLRYAWDCVGGPSWAALRVVGPEAGVWEAAEWLRCPVEIYSPLGELVWWGYVNGLQAGGAGGGGSVSLGVGLDGMANKVAAAYTVAASIWGAPPTRVQTAWAEDMESQAEYGVKERVLTVSGHDALLAERVRDAELARAGLPPVLVGGASLGGSVALWCRGWFSTLGWRYYAQPAGLLEWPATSGMVEFGRYTEQRAWAQKIVYGPGDDWTALGIEVKLQKRGGPADGVSVSLRADTGGLPGAVLASGVVDQSRIGGAPVWLRADLGAGYELGAGSYWVVVVRTGGENPDHAYLLGVDDDYGYQAGGGVLYLVNGVWTGWINSGGGLGCMGFRVLGEQDNVEQVAALVAGVGQFLTGTEGEQAGALSAASTCQWRGGTWDGLREVDGLLRWGADGRLLARVRADRVVELRPAPAVSAGPGYWLNADGGVVDRWGGALAVGACVAGEWVGLGDVIPGSADVSRYGRVSPFWVEGSVYEVGSGRLRLLGEGADLLKGDVRRSDDRRAGGGEVEV